MDRNELDKRADRIERICRAHRLNVRVQGGVVTPRCVRFHLALDRGLPAARLAPLEEDFALALNVPRARIVRRDGILTVETSRPDFVAPALVRLQAALPPLAPYTALLGRDEEGPPLLLRFSSPDVGPVLVSGEPGAGKTALLRTVLTSLALANAPDDLRVVLIDPQEEHGAFTGLPHLVGRPLTDPAEAERWLSRLVEEAAWRQETGVCRPVVLVAVDDLDTLLALQGTLRETLARLLPAGPVGMHFLAAARHPSALPTALAPAHFPAHVCGRGESAPDLAGAGDFLLTAAGENARFQAARVHPAEVTVMVEMLSREMPRTGAAGARLPARPRFWGKIAGLIRPAAPISAAAEDPRRPRNESENRTGAGRRHLADRGHGGPVSGGRA